MRTITSTTAHGALAALFFLAGCAGSHGRSGPDSGAGERCGPTVCAVGQVCCNASCGICTAPDEGCPAIACVDAGGGELCGGSVCGEGQTCCPGCPGAPDFCVSGSFCPGGACPPPPPGCESCAEGELCCPGCGSESFCASGPWCPDLDCPPPPPGCESCGAGELCCPGCPGTGSFCVSGSECPVFDCPMPVCEGLSYCDCTAATGCEPLVDLTPGCVCPCDDPFNCTGELCACACGGAEYRGCATQGQCAETELHCGFGCSAVRGPDGCLTCVCAGG